jgi:hypothetical protein
MTQGGEDPVLDALRFGWGKAYRISGSAELGYRARRRDGLGGDITAGDPDGLWKAVREDFGFKPVPLPRAGM